MCQILIQLRNDAIEAWNVGETEDIIFWFFPMYAIKYQTFANKKL